jgi:putative FmdB family regulatory protein
MPIYDYRCKECKEAFEVLKSIREADNIEQCPYCNSECDKTHRMILSGKEFYGEKPEEPFYSIALGKWVKGIKDNRRQAAARGLIEIGNENVNKILDRSDREREQRSNSRWDEFKTQRIELRAQ